MFDDAEVERMRRAAEGERPFNESALYERLSRLGARDRERLAPAARLAIGFYEASKRRAAMLRGGGAGCDG